MIWVGLYSPFGALASLALFLVHLAEVLVTDFGSKDLNCFLIYPMIDTPTHMVIDACMMCVWACTMVVWPNYYGSHGRETGYVVYVLIVLHQIIVWGWCRSMETAKKSISTFFKVDYALSAFRRFVGGTGTESRSSKRKEV